MSVTGLHGMTGLWAPLGLGGSRDLLLVNQLGPIFIQKPASASFARHEFHRNSLRVHQRSEHYSQGEQNFRTNI